MFHLSISLRFTLFRGSCFYVLRVLDAVERLYRCIDLNRGVRSLSVVLK